MNRSIFYGLIYLVISLSIISCANNDDSSPVDDDQSELIAEDFTASIEENPENNALIGTLIENPEGLSFRLYDESLEGALSLNTNTGELTVLDATLYDYELVQEITATFEVAEGIDTITANITLDIVDDPLDSKIYVGDVFLTNQTQVNNFGADNYEVITGKLTIGVLQGSNNSIVDLTPLNSLYIIGNDLKVIGNSALEDLDGLENLIQVGGSIRIKNNDTLKNIDNLSSIQRVLGMLSIRENNGITTVVGSNTLTRIDVLIEIKNNNNLISISGFENLNILRNKFSITANQSLQNISGFNSLTNLNQALIVSSNYSLLSINGFHNLLTLKHLRMDSNTALSELNAFTSLISIEDGFFLRNLNQLQHLDNFTSLSQSNSIEIYSCGVTNIEGLASINDTVFYIIIEDNDSLLDLRGLQNIPSITQRFRVENNDLLESIDHLSSLTYVGQLRIIRNPNIQYISGFPLLATSSEWFFIENQNLERIGPFEALTSVGSTNIESHNNLISIQGMGNLTNVGSITLTQNEFLESIEGYNNITTANLIRIRDSNSLIGLDGLSALNQIEKLAFFNNINLIDYCSIEALVVNDGISQYLRIEGNGYDPEIIDFLNGDCSL